MTNIECPSCNLKVGTYDGRVNYHTVNGQPGGEECPASHTHIAAGVSCTGDRENCNCDDHQTWRSELRHQ